MTALILAPFYVLWNVHILWRILNWAQLSIPGFQNRPVLMLIAGGYACLVLCVPLGYLLPKGKCKRIVMRIGNDWLGVLLYLSLMVLLGEGIGLSRYFFPDHQFFGIGSKGLFVFGGFVFLGLILFLLVWSRNNAGKIRVTPYEIRVNKRVSNRDHLRVLLAADLHLGYNIGISHMKQMVEKINEQNPDLVVIAGDIFENDFEALEDEEQLAEILRGIHAPYGVYACYGNHDIEELLIAGFTFGGDKDKKSSPEMDAFLKKANIRLLKDEGVQIDGEIYLYGRADYERIGMDGGRRKSAKEITSRMDHEKPILVLDHEPRELQELADAGVDVDLCGHTHGGQLFPANLTCGFLWENSVGYLKKGNMHNIVTSGVGLFGPNMRIGSKAEICAIDIQFQK